MLQQQSASAVLVASVRRASSKPFCRTTDRLPGNRGAKSSSRSEAPAEEIRLRRLSTEVTQQRRQPRLDRLPDSYASSECPFYSRKCTWFYRRVLKVSSCSFAFSKVLSYL